MPLSGSCTESKSNNQAFHNEERYVAKKIQFAEFKEKEVYIGFTALRPVINDIPIYSRSTDDKRG